MVNALMQFAWVATLLIGAQVEGLRVPQFTVSLIFILNLVLYVSSTNFYTEEFNFFGQFNMTTWILSIGCWLHSVHFTIACGACNFDKMESAGDSSPYHVGIRRVKLTDKELEASIFYPVDKK